MKISFNISVSNEMIMIMQDLLLSYDRVKRIENKMMKRDI